GNSKALLRLGGVPLAERVRRRLAPQVDEIVVSAPHELLEGVPFVPDLDQDLKGPLAGLYAALAWARQNRAGPGLVATAAVDTPFFPGDLVERLFRAGAPAVAFAGGSVHPTFGLWQVSFFENVAAYRNAAAKPSLRGLAEHVRAAQVDFADEAPFFNINSPDELAEAEKRIQP
ncbi:MAG TPA: NTP transferase domain-containing protein, partial [Sphingomonadales bacterium]|nr:NTP transferase domain-containing protein [Sphingomonadales bacterium]